jgi:D-psicose/D-tagatose/L-ribulose 3-epimerase
MKAGFSLLLWTSHVTEQHFPIIEKLARAGYDGVEIPILGGTPAHYAKVLKVVQDNGLACDVVTNMPDAAHNPLSPNRKQRQSALDFMKRVIDCTKALGADLL